MRVGACPSVGLLVTSVIGMASNQTDKENTPCAIRPSREPGKRRRPFRLLVPQTTLENMKAGHVQQVCDAAHHTAPGRNIQYTSVAPRPAVIQ